MNAKEMQCKVCERKDKIIDALTNAIAQIDDHFEYRGNRKDRAIVLRILVDMHERLRGVENVEG